MTASSKRRSRTAENENERSGQGGVSEERRSKGYKASDALDEAIAESFPASDPPVGWAGRDEPSSD